MQPNGSPTFNPTQNAIQNGTSFNRHSRQASGSSQLAATYLGNSVPMSKPSEPVPITELPQNELEQLTISRRAEISRLQGVNLT